MIKVFTDLTVWQESHQLVLEIYKITRSFPKNELFGLTNQMQRAVVSITSNIAEGFGRKTIKDKLHFYYISRGSLTEIQNQIMIAKDLNYIELSSYAQIFEQSQKVHRLLNAVITSLSKTIQNGPNY